MHSADLAKAFLAHDEMLTQQVDAFAGQDYAQAHDLAYSTYQDMFGLSGQLADAFGETVAARLPQGGATPEPEAWRRAGERRERDEGGGCRVRRPWPRSPRSPRSVGDGGRRIAGGGRRPAPARRGVDRASTAASTATSDRAGTFRSVRSYADVVAEPVRLRIPALGVDTRSTRLGKAPRRLDRGAGALRRRRLVRRRSPAR